MTSANVTYSDRLKLAYHLRHTIANNPEAKLLRERLQQAPEDRGPDGGPNVYVLPYNVLLSAKGFLLEVPKGDKAYYRPLRANRMPHEMPPAELAEDAILRSIHDYVVDPGREMRPAGQPYVALQRAQLSDAASGMLHALGRPWRALHRWATHEHAPPREPPVTRPWFEG